MAKILAITNVNDKAAIARAAEILRAGKIIALPTETVYGLVARADDLAAMKRLAEIKGREENKPFQRLLARAADAAKYDVTFDTVARQLAGAFWPGSMTLVVPDAAGNMIGLRVPDHPVTQAIIAAAEIPVAASSANLSGESPCLSAEEVAAQFGEEVEIIVAAPPACRGIASTVIEVKENRWRILRAGALTESEIRRALTPTDAD
jgi:L-threonylcarbamoyladenylate synthase